MSATAAPMADVVISCPHCGRQCEALAWVLGRHVVCPSCQRRFQAVEVGAAPPPRWVECRSERINLGPPRFEDVRPGANCCQSSPAPARPKPPKAQPKSKPKQEPESLPPYWRCVRCQRVGPPEFVERIAPVTYVVFGIIAFMFPLLFLLAYVYPIVPTEKFFGCPGCRTRVGRSVFR